MRLLLLGARAVADAVRWAERSEGRSDANRAGIRATFRASAGLAVAASLMSVTAARSSRWRRLSWAVGAAGTGLAAVWSAALGTAISRVARSATVDHGTGPDR